jgi:nucleoside-diphosphate-sugar epimerase
LSTKVVKTVKELESLLSTPAEPVVHALTQLKGDLLLLGAGGKLGPSLAHMARRASDAAGVKRQIIAVSRFASPSTTAKLEAAGIKTIACDLLDENGLNRLPDAPNVIYLAGMKFGTSGNKPLTWALNSYLPALVCQKFRGSRIVALSTGNVYGMVPVTGEGSKESDSPAPVGEYAMSCLGRERIFEYFSRELKIQVSVIRLNYACDLRYGVLVDLAQRIWNSETVDLSMGHFNTIWQADANAMILLSLLQTTCPPFVLNVTGPESLSVQAVCARLAKLMKREPCLVGEPAPTALLSNAQAAFKLFGPPAVDSERLLRWVADWVMHDRPTLQKPTHFESRDGKF